MIAINLITLFQKALFLSLWVSLPVIMFNLALSIFIVTIPKKISKNISQSTIQVISTILIILFIALIIPWSIHSFEQYFVQIIETIY